MAEVARSATPKTRRNNYRIRPFLQSSIPRQLRLPEKEHGVANEVRDSGVKIIDVLTETIAREKASLHVRIESLRNGKFADSDTESRRRPGPIYEVFQGIID